MLALLDGDIFCYRVGYTTELEDEAIAAWRIDEMIQDCLLNVQADEYRIFLTCENNFRKAVYPEYKANRTQPKPRHLQFLKEHLKKEYNAEISIGMEADDYLGIYQNKDPGSFSTTICSIDKDLLQVPGNHYNFVKKEFSHIIPSVGIHNFYKQMLTGDATDNIKGIAGIGPKKAEKALEGYTTEKEMFDKVRSIYDCDEYMIMTGLCLWIKRTLDDNWKDRFDKLVGG